MEAPSRDLKVGPQEGAEGTSTGGAGRGSASLWLGGIFRLLFCDGVCDARIRFKIKPEFCLSINPYKLRHISFRAVLELCATTRLLYV